MPGRLLLIRLTPGRPLPGRLLLISLLLIRLMPGKRPQSTAPGRSKTRLTGRRSALSIT
jgi:hypothetical protein